MCTKDVRCEQQKHNKYTIFNPNARLYIGLDFIPCSFQFIDR